MQVQVPVVGAMSSKEMSSKDDDLNDDNALMRFEWMEACVRMAFAKVSAKASAR